MKARERHSLALPLGALLTRLDFGIEVVGQCLLCPQILLSQHQLLRRRRQPGKANKQIDKVSQKASKTFYFDRLQETVHDGLILKQLTWPAGCRPSECSRGSHWPEGCPSPPIGTHQTPRLPQGSPETCYHGNQK